MHQCILLCVVLALTTLIHSYTDSRSLYLSPQATTPTITVLGGNYAIAKYGTITTTLTISERSVATDQYLAIAPGAWSNAQILILTQTQILNIWNGYQLDKFVAPVTAVLPLQLVKVK